MHSTEGGAAAECHPAGLQWSLLLTLQVYFSNGVQIIPPHDASIAAAIQAEQSLWDLSMHGDPVTDPLQEISGKHYSARAAQWWMTISLCSLYLCQISHAVRWQRVPGSAAVASSCLLG